MKIKRKTAGWLAAFTLAGGVLVFLAAAWASLPGSRPPGTTAVSGAFTSPHNHSGNVQARTNLHATGTISNLQPGHKLLLFLQWSGQQNYWAGSPWCSVDAGRWKCTIFVGDPGNITLWLADLGPKARHTVMTDVADQDNGFPGITQLGPDVTIVRTIQTVAVASAHAAATGTITDPPSGASDVHSNKNLRLAGTASDIPSGYLLDLFLQFVNSGNGIRYYIASDPKKNFRVRNGHWEGSIFIGAPGPIIIRLVLLSPLNTAYVESQVNYQNIGYPNLPGTVLTSANYTAK